MSRMPQVDPDDVRKAIEGPMVGEDLCPPVVGLGYPDFLFLGDRASQEQLLAREDVAVRLSSEGGKYVLGLPCAGEDCAFWPIVAHRGPVGRFPDDAQVDFFASLNEAEYARDKVQSQYRGRIAIYEVRIRSMTRDGSSPSMPSLV